MKTCTPSKTASPLQCQFGGLLPATKYEVNIRSCLPNSIGCSGNATILAVTTPNGVLNGETMRDLTTFQSSLTFFLTAPENFNLENITRNNVSVRVEEPKVDNAVRHYEAFVKGGSPQQACIIQALADPLSCTISNLMAGQEYTVGVKACAFGNHGCGYALEKPFRTR